MQPDSINLARIYRETLNRLDRYEARVDEARSLDAALEFSNWLLWSGIIQLLTASPQPEPLKVDGPFLAWKCEELQRKIRDRYRLNNMTPQIDAARVESIERKLDIIAAHIGKFVPPVISETTETGEVPVLHVLSGGHS